MQNLFTSVKNTLSIILLLSILGCNAPRRFVGTYRDNDENLIYGTLNLYKDGSYAFEYISGCLLPDVHSSGKWRYYKKQIILKSSNQQQYINSIPTQHLEINDDTLIFDNWRLAKVTNTQKHTDSLKSMELECLFANTAHKDYCTRFNNDSTLTFSLNKQERFTVINAIEHSTKADFLTLNPYLKIYIYNNNRVDTLCIENSRNYVLNAKPMIFPDTTLPSYLIRLSVNKRTELSALLNRNAFNSFTAYGTYLPFWIPAFKDLKELSLSGAAPMDSILPTLANFKQLEKINFNRQNMNAIQIAAAFQNLKQAPVTSIKLSIDKSVSQLPENICLLNKLKDITLWNCENLHSLPACLNDLPALQIHIICPKSAVTQLQQLQQAYKQLNIQLDTLSD